MKPVVILPAAQADLLETFAYYAESGGLTLALELFDRVRQVSDRIAASPQTGAPRILQEQRLTGLRSVPLEKFDSYRVYYLELDDEIRIIRILHGSRDLISILEASPIT